MVAPLAEHHDQLAALCRRYGVRRLEVIGSVARGEAKPHDVDLLVEFAHPCEDAFTRYFDFKDELETLLNRPVDLISMRALENQAFRTTIAPERTAIYESVRPASAGRTTDANQAFGGPIPRTATRMNDDKDPHP